MCQKSALTPLQAWGSAEAELITVSEHLEYLEAQGQTDDFVDTLRRRKANLIERIPEMKAGADAWLRAGAKPIKKPCCKGCAKGAGCAGAKVRIRTAKREA